MSTLKVIKKAKPLMQEIEVVDFHLCFTVVAVPLKLQQR